MVNSSSDPVGKNADGQGGGHSVDHSEEESKHPTLTSFPNKRTTLSYEEFNDLYDQAYKQTMSDDSMITSIFEMFDYDKYVFA